MADEDDNYEGASNEDKFDRAYVEKIRKESQGRRVELKPWKDAFDAYANEDVAIIQEAYAAAASSDPDTASKGAQQLENINAVFSGREPVDLTADKSTKTPASKEQEVSDTDTDSTPESSGPLSAEDVAKLVASTVTEVLAADNKSRQEEQARSDAMTKLDAEMTELGFDPNSFEGKMLLVAARDETEGDLPKAAEFLKARDQKHIDTVLDGDKDAKGDFPKTSPTKSAAQSDEGATKILTIEDAEAAIRADFSAAAGETAPSE